MNLGYIPFGLLLIIAVLLALFGKPAHAFDHGFDPLSETSIWMRQLVRPDFATSNCCGKGDAYGADIYNRNPDGSYDIVITDGDAITFPDGTKRVPLKNGTEIHVEKNKVNPENEQAGNPTGHAWVFVSPYVERYEDEAHEIPVTRPGTIYCFVPRAPNT
jgi:hypothetical protein